MADGFCRDCQSYTPLVYDHQSGHTICSECGLLLGSTVTVKANNPGLKPDSPVGRAFKTIDDMAGKLGLHERVNNRAKELYKKADDSKIIGRQRNPKAVVAACLYLACQQEGLPRTLKEINGVAEGARIKEIHKCMDVLKKELEVGTRTIIHAKDIARRYCANLGLNHHAIRAVQEAVQKTEEYDIRRNSTSILAAAIFMVTQLSENKMTVRGKSPWNGMLMNIHFICLL